MTVGSEVEQETVEAQPELAGSSREAAFLSEGFRSYLLGWSLFGFSFASMVLIAFGAILFICGALILLF